MNDETPRRRIEFERDYAALSAAINEAVGRLTGAGPQHDGARKRLVLAAYECDLAWERLAKALEEESGE